jgi:hypothetical protein
MQRDEGDLLDAWIKHHVRLLGSENVFIFDNGSSDERTAAVLQQARKLGISVFPAGGPNDFERKGVIVSSFIKSRTDFDWFFPTDTDELLGVEAGGFSTNLALIEEELANADQVGLGIVRIQRQVLNRPHTTRGYWYPMKKVGVKPSAKVTLDLGFHLYHFGEKADIVPSETIYLSKVVYLHFRNRPLPLLLHRARLKLKDRVPDFRPETLKARRGSGIHLTRYFDWTEADYAAEFGDPVVELSPVFDDLGLAVPYSEPALPMSDAERKRLYSPVNLHRAYSAVAVAREEVDKLLQLMEGVGHYLEIGTGGFTAMACVAGVPQVTSINTCSDDLSQLLQQHKLEEYIESGRLRLRNANLGGRPENGATATPTEHQIVAYLSEVVLSGEADLIRLDGPHRVAAAAAAYLASPRAVIAIHDYVSRPHYRAVEGFLELVEHVGELGIFRTVPGKTGTALAIRRQNFRDAR